jgi:hypothetical protein
MKHFAGSRRRHREPAQGGAVAANLHHDLEAWLNRRPRPGDASLRNALAVEHDVDLVAPGFAHACRHILKTACVATMIILLFVRC